jgi:hypothetical protein
VIDNERLNEIFFLCLFVESEVDDDGKPKVPYLDADGIMNNFCFHEERYRQFEHEVVDMLKQMQPEFFEPAGLTFLGMPTDKDDISWAEHAECEMLLALAVAGGYARYPIDRDMWKHLFGGVPLIQFSITPFTKDTADVDPASH